MLKQKLRRRLSWYKARFQVNNPVVGRVVELLGNKVRMDGLTYSVDCPNISAGHKSTLAFGLHEIEERTIIRRCLPKNIPVVELGGGLGVVACLTNRTLENPKHHIVVEANPGMIPILERNRDLNGCKFQVVNSAIAYERTSIRLRVDSDFVSSTVEENAPNSVLVPTTTIANLMNSRFESAGIVCDIEGGEAELVERELPQLGERIQFFMAEMHPLILGTNRTSKLLAELETLGFHLREKIGDSVFYSRS